MYSFSRLNPDWELKLHITTDAEGATWSWNNNKQTFDAGDYRGRLHEIENLQILNEDSFPGLHGVHQSDILRNRYLSEDGGLWSDIDIIYYRPMDVLGCNLKENAEHLTGLCIPNNRWLPIAFMLAGPGSPYFTAVHNHQMAIFRATGGKGEYQKFGTKIYQYIFKQDTYAHFKIPKHEVYQCHWRMHEKLFQGGFSPQVGVGIHWYGGSPAAARLEPKITHKNWRDFPIAKAIQVTL